MNFDPKSIENVLDIGNLEVDKVKEKLDLVKASESNIDVNINQIYGELGKLISTGNNILTFAEQAVEYEINGENISGIAQLLNSVKDVLKEFTKIHTTKVRHEQQKELEDIKLKAKKELLELKYVKEKELKVDSNAGESIDCVNFNQEDIISKLAEIEKSKEEESD